MSDAITDEILSFLNSKLDRPATVDEDIINAGLVNSLIAIQIISFVEEKFEIELSDDDISIETFRTPTAIANLVRSKNGS